MGGAPFGDAGFEDLAGYWRGQFDRGLGRLDLAEWLKGGDLVAGVHVPGEDFNVVNALANVGQAKLEGHASVTPAWCAERRPRSATRSAASSASGTMAPQATRVTSVPRRRTVAWPIGIGVRWSGSSPRAERYSRIGSMNTTGSGSSMAASSSPAASAAVLGTTTLMPGLWTSCASRLSEWCSGVRTP